MRKFVTISFLLLVFCMCINTIHAQTVSLKGTIIDSELETPVSYASVHIQGQSIGTISDSSGFFSFEFEKTFLTDTIIVSSVGYKRFKAKINELNYKQAVTIELNDSLFLIDEVIALCYNNIEVHKWASKNDKKKTMLSFASREVQTSANFIKVLKEYHGKPKVKSDLFIWKRIQIKKFPVKKTSLLLATYTCSYCPLEDDYLVAFSVRDRGNNNLVENDEYKEFLIKYFQNLLDISLNQGVDFEQIELRNGLAFEKEKEITYTGKCFSYYNKGQKGKVGEYIDGKETGVWSWWFENGQLGKEVNYKNGKMTGSCKWWFPDGQLKRQSEFLNGKKEGLSVMYFTDGIKKFEGNYANDEMHGTCTWWYETGERKKESIYDQGVFKEKTEWDKKGNVIERVTLK